MKKLMLAALVVFLTVNASCVPGKATESLDVTADVTEVSGTVADAEVRLDNGAEATEGTDGVTEVESALGTASDATDTGETGFGTAPKLSIGKVLDGSTTRMRYLDRVGASIHITDAGVATVTADAYSYDSALTNLLIVAELQQLRNGEWYTLRTYRYFTGDSAAIISETCEVDRGYYYRVVNTTTAYAGNDSETRVLESPEWNFFVPGT